jgi:transposase InsO family protein
MVWKATSIVDQREEFARLAGVAGANMSELCQRFGISRTTGYKWLARFQAEGDAGLRDRSRRPEQSPGRTDARIEDRVVELRRQHPAWGGRKLRARLLALQAVSEAELPAASTITEILRRHQLLDAAEASKHQAFTRFERPRPNDLWQMDFKGHFAVTRGGRCHPLTVLDDHSRFAVALRACENEQAATVQTALSEIFRRYGLPNQMLTDNGSPWGDACKSSYTGLSVWLLRLGIEVSHGRPYHPQTQGKDERFHRTLNVELLCRLSAVDVPSCQPPFDRFRDEYNHERPHEALQMATPISRYQVSPRVFPETLPPIEYGSDLAVRKVSDKGWLSYRSRPFNVGQAFEGLSVGLRPAAEGPDGWIEVRFCQHRLGHLNLHDSNHDRLIRRRDSEPSS